MTVSGSTDFTLTTNELIDEAFDLCGIGSEGEAISADQYQRAKRSLNLIVKRWGAEDHLWIRTAASVALVADQATYSLTPKPLRISEVRRKVTASSIETPLTEWARAQYMEMTAKTTDSIPNSYYYDPQRDTGTLYVWPVPSTSTASSMTIEYTALRKLDDFDTSSDSPDLPQEWLQALTYALAEQLALKYGTPPDIRQEITARAADYKAKIDAWDTEPASLFLQPDSWGL